MARAGVRLVVFDLDGTLVPTMQGYADVAAALISRKHGWSLERARRGYIETSGIPFAQQLDLLFPGDAGNPRLARAFEQRKLRVFYGARIAPAVRRSLAALRRAGHLLAVSSNNFDWLVQGMMRREVPGLFHRVLGYRDGFAKGPAHFDVLFATLGVAPTECLFVGDSLSDLDKARSAGTRFAAVAGTLPREAFVARDARVPVLRSVAELSRRLRGPVRTRPDVARATG